MNNTAYKIGFVMGFISLSLAIVLINIPDQYRTTIDMLTRVILSLMSLGVLLTFTKLAIDLSND